MRVLFAVALLVPLSVTSLEAQHPFAAGGAYDPAVPTPLSVLGYEVGDRFTPHHMMMRYLERLAGASPRVHLDTLARTFEGREVVMVTVTSEANQRRMDQIRVEARHIADPRGVPASDLAGAVARLPAIVWL